MKKIIFLIFGLVLLFSLGACNLTPDSDDDTSEDEDNTTDNNNQNNNTDTTPVEKLETPVLVINEETGVVTWRSIEDASHYNYIINDGEILTTTSTTITLQNENTLSVQAANSDIVSEWSYAVTNYDTSDVYDEYKEKITVKFHNTTLDSVTVNFGDKISKPKAPEKQYYTFDNWYADPFYLEVYDFNQSITSDTIIYANYIESTLLNDTYYWVKGSSLITSSVMSAGTSSDWHFIPLKLNEKNTSFKEFYTTVTVTGATSTNPAAFIIMDGFNDDSGRTYWKNGSSDFTIPTNGTYNIYFTVESEYSSGIHAKYETATNSVSDVKYKNKVTLNTPIVSVNSENNIASWNRIGRATSYEVIIDNKEVVTVKQTTITLDKGSHITVRAVGNDEYSNWSIPKANVDHIVVMPNDDYMSSVYFVGYDSYKVAINSVVNPPAEPTKDGFSFGGWYLDYAATKEVKFPYTVTTNVVFYPKWVADTNYETKIYYNLVTETGAYIKGLTWNLDNYTFDEYETGVVELNAGTKYYIVSVDDENVKYGPYTVAETGKYKMYFSEENSWDGSNVYISAISKTFYITNNKKWTDTIYVYLWNSSTNEYPKSWPGVEATYVETNSYGESIYMIEVDVSKYDMMIISHGTINADGSYKLSSQTIDLVIANYSKNGFYFTDKNTDKKYQVGTWNK